MVKYGCGKKRCGTYVRYIDGKICKLCPVPGMSANDRLMIAG